MNESLETLLGLCALAAVLVLAFILLQRLRLTRDLKALTADMTLAENVARIGYFSRAANSNRATWSPGMFEVFGQDPRQFTPVLENIGPLFVENDFDAIRALTRPDIAHKGGEAEVRIRCPDGKIKHVLIAIRHRVNKGDKVVGIFGIVADVTARKVAERATIEREEQLQRAVSAMGAAIWDWDIGTDRMFTGRRFAVYGVSAYGTELGW